MTFVGVGHKAFVHEWQWNGSAWIHNPRGRKCAAVIEPMEFETLDTIIAIATMHRCRDA